MKQSLTWIDDTIFGKISQTYGVNINVAPTLGLARVTGNYEACEIAFRAVAASLNHVKVERLAVGFLGEWKLHMAKARPLWRYMGDLTKTHIWSDARGTVSET